VSLDELTFRRICEQLERELHRCLAPEEVTALRLAQQASPGPVLVERRKTDVDAEGAADRRTPPE